VDRTVDVRHERSATGTDDFFGLGGQLLAIAHGGLMMLACPTHEST